MTKEIKYAKTKIDNLLAVISALTSIVALGTIIFLILNDGYNILLVEFIIVFILSLLAMYQRITVSNRSYIIFDNDLIRINRGFIWKYEDISFGDLINVDIFGESMRLTKSDNKETRINLKLLTAENIKVLKEILEKATEKSGKRH